MTVRIRIPANLRQFSGGQAVVETQSQNVGAAIESLVEQWPGLRDKILDSEGQIHSFLNVFVGHRDIRDLNGVATALASNDELLVVPALAGG